MLDPRAILEARILIVDDQIANIEVLEQLLSGAGYSHMKSTTNPRAVCGLHARHAYDLILLDLQMPNMDGFAVMADLAEQLRSHYLPVVVLTAQPSHKLRALQAGARDFISKPFDLLEVKTRIHNALEARLLYRQLTQHNIRLEAAVQARTAELRASEARYRRLTELACDGYWEQDATGRFTEVSGLIQTLLQPLLTQRPNAPATPLVEWDEEGWNASQREQLYHHIANRQPFLDLSLSRRTAEGVITYYRICGEPMFDVACQFSGYRGTGVECAGPQS